MPTTFCRIVMVLNLPLKASIPPFPTLLPPPTTLLHLPTASRHCSTCASAGRPEWRDLECPKPESCGGGQSILLSNHAGVGPWLSRVGCPGGGRFFWMVVQRCRPQRRWRIRCLHGRLPRPHTAFHLHLYPFPPSRARRHRTRRMSSYAASLSSVSCPTWPGTRRSLIRLPRMRHPLPFLLSCV